MYTCAQYARPCTRKYRFQPPSGNRNSLGKSQLSFNKFLKCFKQGKNNNIQVIHSQKKKTIRYSGVQQAFHAKSIKVSGRRRMSFSGTQKALMSGLGVPGIPQVEKKCFPCSCLLFFFYIVRKLEEASKNNERTKRAAVHKCTQMIKQKPNKPHYIVAWHLFYS